VEHVGRTLKLLFNCGSIQTKYHFGLKMDIGLTAVTVFWTKKLFLSVEIFFSFTQNINLKNNENQPKLQELCQFQLENLQFINILWKV
jgi:hypothetical protein